MKRILLLTVSAVLSGIVVMYLPRYLWHNNFSDMLLVPSGKELPEYYKTRWALLEPTQITPFYTTLTISFIISLIVYAFLKRRLFY